MKELETPRLTIPVRVGTMGWSEADWQGVFYPPNTPARDTIGQYARAFDTVEIDSTAYGTPRDSTVKHWRDSTPANFIFCAKVPRLITHERGLVNVGTELREFVQAMAKLGEKRGPMLLQMPPSFTRTELPNLQAFLPTLRDLQDASARFAIEFRHRSLIGPDLSAMLTDAGVALAATDYPMMPRRLEATADFTYLRLIGRHGAFPQHREVQGDCTPAMEQWAAALERQQARFRIAYVFCNNDYEGYAPSTANRFKQMLGLGVNERPPDIQGSLF